MRLTEEEAEDGGTESIVVRARSTLSNSVSSPVISNQTIPPQVRQHRLLRAEIGRED